MKNSWFHLIRPDFDDQRFQKKMQFFGTFCNFKQETVQYEPPIEMIFSSETLNFIFLQRDHLKKGGGKGCAHQALNGLQS